MSQISLTVPSDDERALVAAGTFFLTLAGKVPALELDDTPEVETTPAITTESVKEELPDAFLQLNEAGAWVDPTDAEVTLQDTLIAAADAVGEFDTNGLPWDGRIHAGSKARLANGAWRYKRGVDKDVVEAVEAELKGLLSTPLNVAPPPPPPPVQEAIQGYDCDTTTAKLDIAPPPPAQETTTPRPPPPQEMTIPAFLQLYTTNIVSKKWTREEVEQAIVNQGVPGVEKIPHLMAHKDLIPKILEELNA